MFQPAPDIISFKDGVDKNYDAIPIEIMGILKAGKRLSSTQVELVEALELLKKELQKSPKDRVKWLKKNREMKKRAVTIPISKEGRRVAVYDQDGKNHVAEIICIDTDDKVTTKVVNSYKI